MADPTSRPSATARKIMRPMGFLLREADDAWSAARRLFECGQSGAAVLDESGRLSGVISQADLAAYLREILRAASEFYSESDHDPLPVRPAANVGQLMSRVIVQIPLETPCGEIERQMLLRRVQRMLVVDAGEVVGVISMADLLAAR